MMSLSEIEYSALRINEQGVLRIRTPRDIRMMPEIYFPRGGFGSTTFIIDHKCLKYEVLNVRMLRESWNPLVSLF